MHCPTCTCERLHALPGSPQGDVPRTTKRLRRCAECGTVIATTETIEAVHIPATRPGERLRVVPYDAYTDGPASPRRAA